MADLFGGGEADNVAATDIRFSEATVAITPDADRGGRVRFMPGILGVLVTRSLNKAILSQFMALGGGDNHPGSNDQLHSSSPADRLANQIWGDGD